MSDTRQLEALPEQGTWHVLGGQSAGPLGSRWCIVCARNVMRVDEPCPGKPQSPPPAATDAEPRCANPQLRWTEPGKRAGYFDCGNCEFCRSNTEPVFPSADNVATQPSGTTFCELAAWVAYARRQRERADNLAAQIDGLADGILAMDCGEPSQSDGACGTALRMLREQAAEIERLRAQLAERGEPVAWLKDMTMDDEHHAFDRYSILQPNECFGALDSFPVYREAPPADAARQLAREAVRALESLRAAAESVAATGYALGSEKLDAAIRQCWPVLAKAAKELA